jgi:hypothetical protein
MFASTRACRSLPRTGKRRPRSHVSLIRRGSIWTYTPGTGVILSCDTLHCKREKVLCNSASKRNATYNIIGISLRMPTTRLSTNLKVVVYYSAGGVRCILLLNVLPSKPSTFAIRAQSETYQVIHFHIWR